VRDVETGRRRIQAELGPRRPPEQRSPAADHPEDRLEVLDLALRVPLGERRGVAAVAARPAVIRKGGEAAGGERGGEPRRGAAQAERGGDQDDRGSVALAVVGDGVPSREVTVSVMRRRR
jgi:hypothetical protein